MNKTCRDRVHVCIRSSLPHLTVDFTAPSSSAQLKHVTDSTAACRPTGYAGYENRKNFSAWTRTHTHVPFTYTTEEDAYLLYNAFMQTNPQENVLYNKICLEIHFFPKLVRNNDTFRLQVYVQKMRKYDENHTKRCHYKNK